MIGCQAAEPFALSFGGHETFPFRLGWLRKGFVAASEDGNTFSADDAVVNLGVGKNMVRSIRTWCLATQILYDLPVEGKSRVRTLRPTQIGELIFSPQGDPYLEDTATLWLIHWLLLSNPSRLSFWRIAFMNSRESEFTKSELVSLATSAVQRNSQKVEEGSVFRDADCFVRTYLAGRTAESEEDFSCPLTDLGLLSGSGRDRYLFVVGAKATLAPLVFGFAFCQFMAPRKTLSISLSDATYAPGSPGQAFKLDEDSVVSIFRALEAIDPEMWRVDIDGPLRSVGLRRELDPTDLLRLHFERNL